MIGREIFDELGLNKNILEMLDNIFGKDCEYNNMNKHLYYITQTCNLIGVELSGKIIEFILMLTVYSKNPLLPKTLYKLLDYSLYNMDIELERKNYIIERLLEVYVGEPRDELNVPGVKKPEINSIVEEYIWATSVYIELLGRSWGYYELSYLYDDAWKNKDKNSEMKIIYNIVNKDKLYTLNRCEEQNGKEEVYLIDVGNNKVYNFSPWTSWIHTDNDKAIDQRDKLFKFSEVDEIIDLCSDDTLIIGKLSDLVQL